MAYSGYTPIGVPSFYGKKSTRSKPKPTGTPYVPPSTQYQPPPQQQVTPPPQVSYGGSQYNQNYAAQQAAAYAAQRAQAQAQAFAQQQAAMQASAAAEMARKAQEAIESRRQMLADQAQARQEAFNSQVNPDFGGVFMGSRAEQAGLPNTQTNTAYGGMGWTPPEQTGGGNVPPNFMGESPMPYYNPQSPLTGIGTQAGTMYQPGWNPQSPISGINTQNENSPFGEMPWGWPEHDKPWLNPGYYLTQQQINQTRGQVEEYKANQPKPWEWYAKRSQDFLANNPQYMWDREQYHDLDHPWGEVGVQDQGGGGGGGWGYPYPSYGGGYNYPNYPGYTYTPQEQVKSWYESMLSWNIT